LRDGARVDIDELKIIQLAIDARLLHEFFVPADFRDGSVFEHYDTVGAALLWTLENGLGQAWTPEVAAAWTELYELLSGIMRRAQQVAAFELSKPAA